MNKYIIPICNIPNSEIYNLTINANSVSECEEKLMSKLDKYSDALEWSDFVKECDSKDVLIGEIVDIETI